MPANFVQIGVASNSQSPATRTFSFLMGGASPAIPGAGNLLSLAVSFNASTGTSIPVMTGVAWTNRTRQVFTGGASTTASTLEIWEAYGGVQNASTSLITITCASGVTSSNASCMEFSGVNGVLPFDKIGITSGNIPTTLTTSILYTGQTAATVSTSELAVGWIFALDDNWITGGTNAGVSALPLTGPINGFTLNGLYPFYQQITGPTSARTHVAYGLQAFYKVLTATGIQSTGGTVSSLAGQSVNWLGITVAYTASTTAPVSVGITSRRRIGPVFLT